MKELLIKTLEELGYKGKVYLQGSLVDDEPLPDSFITFFTNTSTEQDFLDDVPFGTVWRYSVIFYTNNPALMSSEPKRIYDAMKAADFIPQGKGRDIPSGEPTHTGWANEYTYLEI